LSALYHLEKRWEIFSHFLIFYIGPRTQETRRADMDLTSGSATFNENLQLSATLFQDIKTKKYLEKKVLKIKKFV